VKKAVLEIESTIDDNGCEQLGERNRFHTRCGDFIDGQHHQVGKEDETDDGKPVKPYAIFATHGTKKSIESRISSGHFCDIYMYG